MTYGNKCETCNGGCTGRLDAEKRAQEIKAGPYLLFSGILIIVLSAIVRWYFF